MRGRRFSSGAIRGIALHFRSVPYFMIHAKMSVIAQAPIPGAPGTSETICKTANKNSGCASGRSSEVEKIIVKRGCLLIILGILTILIVVAGISLYAANRQIGLFPAQTISHEQVASPETRFRLVIRPDHLGNILLPFLPDASEFPAWLPLDPENTLALMLPHEIALLSHADFQGGHIKLTFFVNERRGGPVFFSLVRDANLDIDLKGFSWNSVPFTYPQRGMLLGFAGLDIPDDVEFFLLDRWSHALPDTPLTVADGHLLSGVLDNRNGELLTMLLTMIEANEGDWQTTLEDPRMETFMEVLVDIFSLHLHADLVDEDTLSAQLRVEADPQIQPELTFLSNIVLLPLLRNYVQTELLLDLSGEAVWDDSQEALLINAEITGLESWITALAKGETPTPVAE